MSIVPEELRRSLGRTDGPLIVDVRSKREFRQARIPGALHLPFWQIPFRSKFPDLDRDRQIVVYCEHGPRAVLARQALQSKGYLRTQCLEGHMLAWRRAGFPVDHD